MDGVGDVYARVSIHAPARGATPLAILMLTLMMFQSTPPRGGRHRKVN